VKRRVLRAPFGRDEDGFVRHRRIDDSRVDRVDANPFRSEFVGERVRQKLDRVFRRIRRRERRALADATTLDVCMMFRRCRFLPVSPRICRGSTGVSERSGSKISYTTRPQDHSSIHVLLNGNKRSAFAEESRWFQFTGCSQKTQSCSTSEATHQVRCTCHDANVRARKPANNGSAEREEIAAS
jgi:hypothetical protein